MSKKKKKTPSTSIELALAADGDFADTLAAAPSANVDLRLPPPPPKQDQNVTATDDDTTSGNDSGGTGSKRNSFSNPLDLLAGLASEHKGEEAETRDGSAAAKTKAKAKKAPTQNTTASAPAPAPEKEKKKRKLLLPVKPVGAKVADDFKVIHSAVTDVPAASSQNFVINNNDVLSGRGGMTNHHPGNMLFRNLIKAKQADYIRATSRHEKAYIARDIVGIMRKLDPPARFLKKDPKNPDKWVEIGDKKAREKASQALREGAPKVRRKLRVPEPTVQQKAMAIAASLDPTLRAALPPPPAVNPAVTPVPVPGAAPPASVPAAATATVNAVTPSSLSPANGAAIDDAATGSKRAQTSLPSDGEPEKKKKAA